MTNTYIDIHILQSVPPSNINRDDTGSPKSAVFGGVRRSRVSSQAWKRATRKYFNESLDSSDIGFRTKRIVEIVAEEIEKLDPSIEEKQRVSIAADVIKAAGIKLTTPKTPKNAPEDAASPIDESGYLLFLSNGQLRKLAELALETISSDSKIDTKKAKAAANADNSFDIALFGRMVADVAELNVDAAAQVAHAISVNAVDNEFDYFTALDDLREREEITGAGMIGTVEYNSSTLYRYATLNINGLRKNLGDDAATARAAQAFVEAFSRSMPTGKQNTFANRTLPEAIVVSVRQDQPINLAGAFEDAINRNNGSSIVTNAANAFAKRYSEIERAYGASEGKALVVSVGDAADPLASIGEKLGSEELFTRIGEIVSAHLGESS
ncbi:MAG: type I-E CRISPR-associated protein Cas7/Cse4/CasC [Mycobacteriaceae bacterium]